MSETTYEVVLKPSGDMELVSTTRTPTHFPEKILERFAGKVNLKIPRMLNLTSNEVGMEDVGLMIVGHEFHWLARVSQLRFRTPVALIAGSGSMVTPAFQGDSDSVDLFWRPDLATMSMSIWFSVSTDGSMADKCFLFATDENWRCYRLPTGNVYEDCAVCMGIYPSKVYNHVGAFMAAVNQFRASNWNADLTRGMEEQSSLMFRFRPIPDGEGFSQEGMVLNGGTWQQLCERAENTHNMQLIELAKGMV